jgi:hypothetical protein
MDRARPLRLLAFGLVLLLTVAGLATVRSSVSQAQEALTPVTLPVDTAVRLRPGKDMELVEANCTLCHTLKPIVTHNGFTADQWVSEVRKMREEYGAPVDAATAARITTYLQTYYATPPPSVADFLLGITATPVPATPRP